MHANFSTLRQDCGLSIEDAASEFGISATLASEWEAGKIVPPERVFRSLALIADFLPKADHAVEPVGSNDRVTRRSGTFAENMRLPVHRWFRYSAGFSAEWAASVIAEHCRSGGDEIVLDPFAGSGTTLLAAQDMGCQSIGFEAHPFIRRVAAAKLASDVDPDTLRHMAARIVADAKELASSVSLPDSPLLQKCYAPADFEKLESLRLAHCANGDDANPASELVWLAITAILRECSGVGTAQWQYVLPNKTKAKIKEPYAAFESRIEMFIADFKSRRISNARPSTRILQGDARDMNLDVDLKGKVGLVVTSPPYPNNYDYADATRLEMTFWREISGWSDLQSSVRSGLVRSCSQHSAAERLDLDSLLDDPFLSPIKDEIRTVCDELGRVRHEHGGKKTYHTMVAAYFADMARVWQSLRSVCAHGSTICFVIGDSAPYGVYVPVDEWMTKLALSSGFGSPRFEKLRDRNIKWKNRKHRVPLKEGHLWLRG